ncbi:NAD(P)-dependent oxidoreductase [Streptomyces sp. Tu 3180]|uniref:NAD-dependent epimerase/dehydratase family protein n=1 Tax=Streptomyces sp. Tu 3180 TaxID=2682611 RepID=UPI0013587E3D|nr:NAD(P)-dependent oxidoreductase [Streptomyces sp. Tu 3180]KAF3468279.1 NAD(P)-dependent oxidoreductase [Streptomyces sp. Tu 3180]
MAAPAPSPAPATGTVLVAGGTGFIGGAVVRALRSRTGPSGAPGLRVLSSRGAPAAPRPGTVRHVGADLTRPESLRGVCEDVTTLVHAVSYVGRDPGRCRAVNHFGTLALLDEARRAGVERVVYVSTASVYGTGPHRGAAEGEIAPRPGSPASESRLRAEHAVLDAGGIVVRPHLVYGEGDRWVVPTVARMLRSVPDWPAEAMPLTSLISVGDLARCVAALVRGPGTAEGPEVYHAADPCPLPLSRLLLALHRVLGLPLPPGGISPAEHRARLARALPALSDHQYALLTQDHWYDGRKLWERTGEEPGPEFEQQLAGCRAWYARQTG